MSPVAVRSGAGQAIIDLHPVPPEAVPVPS